MLNRSSSNNIKTNSKLPKNDIYSFERLNPDEVSLSSFPMGHGTIIAGVGPQDASCRDINIHIDNSLNLSQLQQ